MTYKNYFKLDSDIRQNDTIVISSPFKLRSSFIVGFEMTKDNKYFNELIHNISTNH